MAARWACWIFPPAPTGIFTPRAERPTIRIIVSLATRQPARNLAAWMIGLKKSTGLVQFTLQLAEWKDVAVGISKPSQVNGDRFTTGPLRTAYITLAPTPDSKFSIGQV